MATTKRIHVNMHVIRANKAKPGLKKQPPLTCKTYKTNHKGYEIKVDGPSTLVYRPTKPLDCGAHVWIETKAPVNIDGKIVY